jgi:hypothetical protein
MRKLSAGSRANRSLGRRARDDDGVGRMVFGAGALVPGDGVKRPSRAVMLGGRYWVRTSDLFRVKEARYHCANRPYRCCEVERVLPRWRRDLNPCRRLCRPLPRLSATPPRGVPRGRCLRADDGIRTRDPHLGKVMLYQLSHVRAPPTTMRSPACDGTLTGPVFASPTGVTGPDDSRRKRYRSQVTGMLDANPS